MADTTRKKRERVLTLRYHCQKLSRDIAGVVDVNQSTVFRIMERFEETGTVFPNEKKSMPESLKLLLKMIRCFSSELLIPRTLTGIPNET